MGIEGHESPRDVASEKQKNPWEIFPTDDTSANLSEKEREQVKKKKESKAKRKMQLSKTKKRVNSHRILLLSIVASIIILACGGIFVYTKINGDKKAETESQDFEDLGYPEDFTIKDSVDALVAYDYVTQSKEAALEGVDNPFEDTTKIEDNMDLYIEKLDSDYDKLCYRLYTAILLSSYDNPARAQYILDKIDSENHDMDANQRYIYYKAYMGVYYALGDTENYNIWEQKLVTDPEINKKQPLGYISELEG